LQLEKDLEEDQRMKAIEEEEEIKKIREQ